MATHFHSLPIARVTPDAAGSVALTLSVPEALRSTFDFQPGQFLTLRATVDGQDVRRSYSICSPHPRYLNTGEIEVGIKPVAGGVFSNWAVAQLGPGATIDVLPPEGRFTARLAGARHRVGFVAGSGITPLLSIIASTLATESQSRFTLVYGNQKIATIMFNEVLQDLKDRYPARLSLVHVLSRQPQESALLNGRIDEAKVGELLSSLLPVAAIDEAFLCGPEGMIEGAQRALLAAGMDVHRVHSERFLSGGTMAPPRKAVTLAVADHRGEPACRLDVVLDGKTHHVAMWTGERVLDAALSAGLDLPYSCKGGVCCTCRARVLEGRVAMDRNYTLEEDEMARGFVLTCQSRPLTPTLRVSYDDR